MNILEKVKQFFVDNQSRLIIIASFILITSIAYSLGFIAGRLSFGQAITVNQVDVSKLFIKNDNQAKPFMASKDGDYYYPRNCSSASVLKEENLLEFSTKKEAEDFGYKQSEKCQY
ncbi:hypothetical protein HY061_01135 [Candidatus Azambacteria bacterium]|nr:hypothetical protein [Candidatus Azambacteria bacterium]